MPYNGSGVFNRVYNWVADKNAAIKIRADRMDTEMDGFASGLTNAITRDGQGIPTANISWGGYNLTAVGTFSASSISASGSISAPTATFGTSVTSSLFQNGTLGYAATGVLASLAGDVNSYTQAIIQNKNAGAAASADLTVSNNVSTDTTFYGNFGMNSSGFTGTGSFNLPSAVYLSSTSADLVIGTTTNNSIRFVQNSGATDAMLIDSAGVHLGISDETIYGKKTGSLATGFTRPDDLAYIGTRLSMQGADKKRQIILNAPVDTSGYNSMLPATSGSLSITTQNITTSAPLVVTAAAGPYSQWGDQANRKGWATANLTFSGNTASIGISSITRSGTTATLTTSASHNLVTGSEVTVSGATPAGYNGTYIITVTGATTFTYVMAADPGASASPVGSYTVTNFLWVDVGTDGVLTTGRTLLPPVYVQGSTPSTTANQFTYNITEAKGYYGNGSTAPQTYKVFVGEVQASTATVTSSVAYLVNDNLNVTGLTFVAGTGLSITAAFGSGKAQYFASSLKLTCITPDSGYFPGQVLNYHPIQMDLGNVNAQVRYGNFAYFKNSFFVFASSQVEFNNATTGAGAVLDLTKWRLSINVERTW